MFKTETNEMPKKSSRVPMPKPMPKAMPKPVPELFSITPELVREFTPAKPVKPAKKQSGGTARPLIEKHSPGSLKNFRDWINTYLQGGIRGVEGFTDPSQILQYAYQIEEKILSSKLVENSKKNHLNAVLHYLKTVGAPQDILDHFSSGAVGFNKKAEEKYEENRLTPAQKARGLTWEKLENYYNALLDKNIKDKFKNKGDNTDLIIIGANFLQPPLRSDISNILIVNESEINEDEDSNLLVKKPNGSRYYYMRNYLKTSRSHKKVKIQITEKFNELINKSLEAFPRRYLVQYSTKNMPLTAKYYQASLKRLLGGSSIDDLRMVFVSHFLGVKRSKQEIKKIASAMLTSANRVEVVYNKISDPDESAEAIAEIIADSAPEPSELSEAVPESPKKTPAPERSGQPSRNLSTQEKRQNRLEYLRQNYQKNSEKIKAQAKQNFEKKKTDIYRNRIIEKLKMDRELGITTVRKETLEKYGIDPSKIE